MMGFAALSSSADDLVNKKFWVLHILDEGDDGWGWGHDGNEGMMNTAITHFGLSSNSSQLSRGRGDPVWVLAWRGLDCVNL